jgi:FdrA protein
MQVKTVIKKDAYFDSVTLMVVSSKASALPGVSEAVVVMGTPLNKDLLRHVNMFTAAMEEAGVNDLIIAIKADSEELCDEAIKIAETAMAEKAVDRGKKGKLAPATVKSAVAMVPDANLAIISVPGTFAAREAMQAMKAGMHVMMFSDNVGIDEELALKKYAHGQGLLMMGPDCGTAIINNIGLCFANAVRKGDIGIVGASGTGTQEVCVLIDRLGGGVSQVLGTGGRDLNEAIGGIMMLDCLGALARDRATSVIVLVSKMPAAAVAQKILAEIPGCGKPVVVCFINGDAAQVKAAGGHFAGTLEDAARLAVELSGEGAGENPDGFGQVPAGAAADAMRFLPGQKYLRGLFCGGTLCDEAMNIFQAKVGPAYSNIAKKAAYKLADPFISKEHTFIDLGDDAFTMGKPHPMIDPGLRLARIVQEANDPEVAVILLDFVLGFGACDNPVGLTLPAIEEARQAAAKAGRRLEVVAYVCGTDADPQNRQEQEQKLLDAGVRLGQSNARTAALAAEILANREGE